MHERVHQTMLFLMYSKRGKLTMRTTISLDDDLVERARRFTGLTEKSALVREALKALIERESARRLALLGGSEPQIEAAPRRRSAPAP